jgi:hypothetical protein
MDKIELTKQEVEAVINSLGELPYKSVSGLIQFFSFKLKPQQPQKEDLEPGKGEQRK